MTSVEEAVEVFGVSTARVEVAAVDGLNYLLPTVCEAVIVG